MYFMDVKFSKEAKLYNITETTSFFSKKVFEITPRRLSCFAEFEELS